MEYIYYCVDVSDLPFQLMIIAKYGSIVSLRGMPICLIGFLIGVRVAPTLEITVQKNLLNSC